MIRCTSPDCDAEGTHRILPDKPTRRLCAACWEAFIRELRRQAREEPNRR